MFGSHILGISFVNSVFAITPEIYFTKWGSQENGNGQFNNPWNLELSGFGSDYVVDIGNNRIQESDSNGQFSLLQGTPDVRDHRRDISPPDVRDHRRGIPIFTPPPVAPPPVTSSPSAPGPGFCWKEEFAGHSAHWERCRADRTPPHLIILEPLPNKEYPIGPLKIKVKATDDSTGVANVNIAFAGSSSYGTIYTSPLGMKQDPVEGGDTYVYEQSLYPLRGCTSFSISASDRAGNKADLLLPYCATGPIDKTPPELIILEPEQNAEYPLGTVVKIKIKATDDNIGINQVNIYFRKSLANLFDPIRAFRDPTEKDIYEYYAQDLQSGCYDAYAAAYDNLGNNKTADMPFCVGN
jgi:hypothetical protein